MSRLSILLIVAIGVFCVAFAHASSTCEQGYFRCSGGRCIPNRWLCDGDNDCGDNSDEDPATCASVPHTCQEGYFECSTRHRCVRESFLCDGDNDCGDNSDEDPATCASVPHTCQEGYFKCSTRRRCVRQGFVCDGDNDCGDNSDEDPATCASVPIDCDVGEVKCANRPKCISRYYFCDGDNDCGDNWDEDENVCEQYRPTPPPVVACGQSIQMKCLMPLAMEFGDNPESIREKIVGTNLRELCRPIIRLPECVRTALEEDCTEEGREAVLREVLPYITAYESAINYVCVQNVDVFDAHKECLVTAVLSGTIESQCRHVEPRPSRCPGTEVIDCGINALTNQCGAEIAQHVHTLATKMLSDMGCLEKKFKKYKRGGYFSMKKALNWFK